MIIGGVILDESSENKQRRLNCYEGTGVNNWSCYKDCAFWENKTCTKFNDKGKPNYINYMEEILKKYGKS